jgi:hypothetical protein
VGDGWLSSVLLLRVICLYGEKHDENVYTVSHVKLFIISIQLNKETKIGK